jgi:hypothetical protein
LQTNGNVAHLRVRIRVVDTPINLPYTRAQELPGLINVLRGSEAASRASVERACMLRRRAWQTHRYLSANWINQAISPVE